MTHALFLAPLDSTDVGSVVLVDGDEGRHAVAVRRIKPGECVYVADGAGTAIHGEVLSADKAGLRVRIDAVHTDDVAGPHFVAVQALAKGGRDEDAIEAMTELGVHEVVPWAAQRSIVKWDAGPRGEKQLGKWRTTVREASKQSRRFAVPVVTPPLTSKQLAADVVAHAHTFVLHEEAATYLAQALADKEIGDGERVVFIVGPEGGISPEEREMFAAAGAVEVRIARHVLRSGTAGVVALAQLQALLDPSTRSLRSLAQGTGDVDG